MPKTLFDAPLHVHYCQAYIVPEDSFGCAPEEAFRGQKNGLCGASVPECLFLITGLHTGSVQFRVELHAHTPTAPNHDWEEMVEAPFTVTDAVTLQEWGGENEYSLQLPVGQYRARYAAKEMDAGATIDTADKGPDSYVLQFWPVALETPDEIIKQTSKRAQYWHDVARKRAR